VRLVPPACGIAIVKRREMVLLHHPTDLPHRLAAATDREERLRGSGEFEARPSDQWAGSREKRGVRWETPPHVPLTLDDLRPCQCSDVHPHWLRETWLAWTVCFSGCEPVTNARVPTRRITAVRIWDVSVETLTNRHLLGEHVELHTIYNAHLRGLRGGYSRHPETLRWRGHLRALWLRHEAQAAEMTRRGFRHRSSLPGPTPTDSESWPIVTLSGSIPTEALPDSSPGT
jgi:hypothetical protein